MRQSIRSVTVEKKRGIFWKNKGVLIMLSNVFFTLRSIKEFRRLNVPRTNKISNR